MLDKKKITSLILRSNELAEPQDTQFQLGRSSCKFFCVYIFVKNESIYVKPSP